MSMVLRVALALALLAAAGCGVLPWDVERAIPEQLVPAGVPPAAPVEPIELDALDTDGVQRAHLKSLTLSAMRRSGNFDLLDEVHLWIASAKDPTQPRREIARLRPVPRGQTSIALAPVPGVDLLPYLRAGAQLSTTALGRGPAKDFTFDGVVVITLKI